MKYFEKPRVEIVRFDVEDVITTSGEIVTEPNPDLPNELPKH